MAKILIISEEEHKINELKKFLNEHEIIVGAQNLLISDILDVENPDIILLDSNVNNLDMNLLIKDIKSFITILLLNNNNVNQGLYKIASGFVTCPLDEKILNATIDSNLRHKKALDKVTQANQDLAKNLYQLDALYKTSSQLAGTLDNEKLISIMNEGMDKSLSYSLLCTLTFTSEKEPLLIINSLAKVSDRLLEALKLRAVLNYKSMAKSANPDYTPDIKIEDIKVEKHYKHNYSEYDFQVLMYDNMFSPIYMGENCYGFVEVYRESDFNTEDATCFQTLVQQVSLPLKSAALYQEIKETNIKLEKLERLKSEFISIVSHELRTPLTSIKNSLDILSSPRCGAVNDNSIKFIDMAKRNVQTLARIINDLLDLSKIEAGKMTYSFKDCDIHAVIEYVKSSLGEVAKSRNLNLVVNEGENIPKICADSQRIEQVLTNLVSNAIKFTPENKNIFISTEIKNAENIEVREMFKDKLSKLKGDYLMVTVADEGIGIEEKDLLRAFDKFAQIENSLSRKVGGTGLGLPIAKQLLDAHNGAIWCDSEPEKGSQFHFVLPIVDC